MEEGGESNQRALVGYGKEFYASRMAPKKSVGKASYPSGDGTRDDLK